MAKKYIISFINAVVLVFLNLIYFNSNWILTHEDEIILAINKVESHFFKHGKFKDSDYLFINTAYDNALTGVEIEEDGDSGNIVITNRELLAKLFKKLADYGNNHKYLFCDIIFDKPSNSDTSLSKEIVRVNKMIIPAHYDDAGKKMIYPIFNKKHALADYITFEGVVRRIRLYSSSQNAKTLPLEMYEDFSNNKSQVKSIGLWYNRNYIPHTIFPRYFFDRETMRKREMRLNQVIKMLDINDKMFYEDALKNKIIVIGNFSTDLHPTPIGYLPGSMILFNTFLTLEAQYHLHSILWLLFLFVSMFFLSYYFLFKKHDNNSKSRWLTAVRILKLSGICIFLSILSNIIFGIHTTILLVVIYFEIIHLIQKYLKPKFLS